MFWLGHQRRSGVGIASRWNTDKCVSGRCRNSAIFLGGWRGVLWERTLEGRGRGVSLETGWQEPGGGGPNINAYALDAIRPLVGGLRKVRKQISKIVCCVKQGLDEKIVEKGWMSGWVEEGGDVSLQCPATVYSWIGI